MSSVTYEGMEELESQVVDLPEPILGYAVKSRDWQKLDEANPIYLATVQEARLLACLFLKVLWWSLPVCVSLMFSRVSFSRPCFTSTTVVLL